MLFKHKVFQFALLQVKIDMLTLSNFELTLITVSFKDLSMSSGPGANSSNTGSVPLTVVFNPLMKDIIKKSCRVSQNTLGVFAFLLIPAG